MNEIEPLFEKVEKLTELSEQIRNKKNRIPKKRYEREQKQVCKKIELIFNNYKNGTNNRI